MRIACSIAVVVGLATAEGSSAASDPWKALHRPLDVPRLAAGAVCPVSASVDFERYGISSGLGPGPAYPVLGGSTLDLSPPKNFESRVWGGQKVFWFVLPRYRGPVLIRGRQLNGPHGVRFESGGRPAPELRIRRGETVYWTGQPDRSRGRPSYTRLRAPGCYGYQIDGTTFSRVVVFRARGWSK